MASQIIALSLYWIVMSDLVLLDLKGLKCPLPALRTRKALKGLAAGQRIDVICTDPMSAIDIPHLVNQTGDRLEGQGQDNGLYTFTIVKT